ncbi:MAG: YhcH/YjgK/YiaL family protein [Nanoarchaeota archaeon]
MIFGNLSSPGAMHPKLKEALTHLTKDLSGLEKGKHDLQDGLVSLIIDEYVTKPKAEKKAEQHRNYIDIHAVLSGKENIGLGFPNPQNEAIESYNEAKDRALFRTIANENEITLVPGRFAICFPEDIHRPGCAVNGPCQVRKAVIKIPVSLLS